MTYRIPPLLSPYIRIPPQHSLTLLTGLLGASANWLVLRFLYAALGSSSSPRTASDARAEASYPLGSADLVEEEQDVAVVLVSWMRDFEFWKTEARRAVGLDLPKLQQQGRFVYIDGLTHLFVPPLSSSPSPSASPTPMPSPAVPSNIPLRASAPLPNRPPPSHASPTPTAFHNHHGPSGDLQSHHTTSTPQTPGTLNHTLTSATLGDTQRVILTAINSLKFTSSSTPTPILLILDHPNLLLHSTFPPITAPLLSNLLLTLRGHVHATIISLPGDAPLLAPAAAATAQAGASSTTVPPTPLETDNAAFLVSVAQQGRCVVACRRLGTGWAGDVSGVVRGTRGGGVYEEEDGEGGDGGGGGLQEGEWLYFVGGDGGVRVWERGAGGG